MRCVGCLDVQALATVVVGVLALSLPIGGCLPTQYGPEAAARRQQERRQVARQRGKLQRERRAHEPHPVMAAYRAAVEPYLTADERAAFESVSLYDTQEGDNERLRYMTADHVVRVLLPAALIAHEDPVLVLHAERLQALPPLLNRDVDMVALPVVRDAMHALHVFEATRGRSTPRPRAARGAAGAQSDDGAAGEESGSARRTEFDAPERDDSSVSDDAEEESIAVASEDATDPLAEAMMAEALAEYAEAYASRHGVSSREADAAAAAASDAISAGSMVRFVIEEHGVPREVAVGGALQLYRNMANAARRRERVPRPPRPLSSTPPRDSVTP